MFDGDVWYLWQCFQTQIFLNGVSSLRDIDVISMYVVSKYINNLECNCQSSAFSVAGSLVGVQESRVFTRSHISARGMKLWRINGSTSSAFHEALCVSSFWQLSCRTATEEPPPVSICLCAYKYGKYYTTIHERTPLPRTQGIHFQCVCSCIMLYLSHSKKAAVEEFRKDVFGLAGFFVYKEAKKLINSNRSSQDSQSPQSALQSWGNII